MSSFIYPAFLWLGLALPLLLVPYLKKKKRKKVVFSSLLFFKQKNLSIQKSSKPRLPLRFFLELLSLLFLILALAQFYSNDKSITIAILLDNSLSMEALENNPTAEKKSAEKNSLTTRSASSSRLEQAKQKLIEYTETENRNNDYLLFLSNPSYDFKKQGQAIKKEELQKLLKEIKSSEDGDDLKSSLVNIQKLSPDKIIIISDKKINLVKSNELPVEVFSINEKSENFFLEKASQKFIQKTSQISELDESDRPEITKKPGDPDNKNNAQQQDLQTDKNYSDSTISVKAFFSGNEPINLVAELVSSNKNTQKLGVRKILLKQEIQLKGNGEQEIIFNLSKVPEINTLTEQRLAVQIRAAQNRDNADSGQASLSNSFRDSIASDNILELGKAERKGKENYLFVSPQKSSKENFGINKIELGNSGRTSSHHTFLMLTGEEYLNKTLDELKSYKGAIFYKTFPTQIPPISSVFVMPPENSFFPIKSQIRNPKISSWQNNSEILNYVRVPLIVPEQSLIFAENTIGQSILNSEKGSLFLTKEINGKKYLSLGFEIFPFESKRTPSLSILTLNILNYLAIDNANNFNPESGSLFAESDTNKIHEETLVIDKSFNIDKGQKSSKKGEVNSHEKDLNNSNLILLCILLGLTQVFLPLVSKK